MRPTSAEVRARSRSYIRCRFNQNSGVVPRARPIRNAVSAVTDRRPFGEYVRTVRERIRSRDRAFSVRQVAQRIGVEPAYLSKIERNQMAPPSEAAIRRLAAELGEDPDLLLAMAGKVSSDLKGIILRRPRLFADLLRELKDAPDHAILRVVREVRDGDW